MSPTDTISVAPAAFASTGTMFGIGRTAAAGAISTLARSLDHHWGSAGTDTTGQNFAHAYDPAAFNAVQSGADIVNGLGRLNGLLRYISASHANGNTQAAIDAIPGNTVNPPATIPHYDTPKFGGSYGGDSDAPLGWGLITRRLQGRTWPNGHQDGLDALGDAWSTAADALETLAKPFTGARETVSEQISGEVTQILTQIDLVISDITHTVAQYRSLSTWCSDYSDALTTAHDAIGKALAEVVIAAGVGAVLGSVIGPEGTAGGGALAAGATGEAAGAACVTAVDTLGTAVGGVAGVPPSPPGRLPKTFSRCWIRSPHSSMRTHAPMEISCRPNRCGQQTKPVSSTVNKRHKICAMTSPIRATSSGSRRTSQSPKQTSTASSSRRAS